VLYRVPYEIFANTFAKETLGAKSYFALSQRPGRPGRSSRHWSLKRAESDMHAWSSLRKHIKHTPAVMVGAEILADKSYFGKSGLERVQSQRLLL
jgi:hypothetical protein